MPNDMSIFDDKMDLNNVIKSRISSMRSYNRRVSSNSSSKNKILNKITNAKCEMDSHADTCCAGSTHYLYSTTEQVCDVTPFHSKYETIKSVPVATTVTAYDCPKTGETFILVLDAGHGGKDPGTSGPHSQEKNVALAIVKKAGKLISEKFPDVKIIYTRKDDTFIQP